MHVVTVNSKVKQLFYMKIYIYNCQYESRYWDIKLFEEDIKGRSLTVAVKLHIDTDY